MTHSVDAESPCDDKAKSKSASLRNKVLYLEDELYYSELACEEFNQTQYDEEQKGINKGPSVNDFTRSTAICYPKLYKAWYGEEVKKMRDVKNGQYEIFLNFVSNK